MGLLDNKEIQNIQQEFADGLIGSFTIIPILRKGSDAVFFRRSNHKIYFLENNDWKKCYKILDKVDFKKEKQELINSGWQELYK